MRDSKSWRTGAAALARAGVVIVKKTPLFREVLECACPLALWHARKGLIGSPAKFAEERHPACQSARGQAHSTNWRPLHGPLDTAKKRSAGFLASLVALLFALSPAFAADLPGARLDTIFPPGGQAGTEVEVTLTGADLDEAKVLHFSRPGFTAEPKAKGFAIKIAADVPPGIYDVRAAGLLGVSNPRAFAVSAGPQIRAASTNHTPETALELPIETTVAGAATAAAADYFKFTARQGQRLLIECQAAELDSRLQPVLTVLDAQGRELADARGPLLDFTAPADGGYLVQLHDLTFAGGPDRFYELTLTAGPHLDFILPPAASSGAKGQFTLYGRNLPGGTPSGLTAADGHPLDQLETAIDVPAGNVSCVDGLPSPAAAAIDGFSYRLRTAGGASNPVFISFTSLPLVAAAESKEPAPAEQKITPPCEIDGQFFPANKVAAYAFEAKKGEAWWIEIVSERLGAPSDPFLLVQGEKSDPQEGYASDVNAGGRRFYTASRDPALRFEAKADGPCRIKVRDLFGGVRRDPSIVYRLLVRREAPDFHLAAIIEPRPEKNDDRAAAPRGALLRAGGTIAIKVAALRADGFAGGIELSVQGLPPGIECPPAQILAGQNETVLLLTAPEKTEAWLGDLRIFGKATIGGAEIVREARGAAVRFAVADYDTAAVQPRLARDFSLAVSAAELAPISIAPAEEKTWEASVGTKLEIPLEIKRRGEFKEALKLKASGAPGIEALPEINLDPTATKATATLDLATLKIPPGAHTFHFEALAKGKNRGRDVTTTIFSTPIRFVVDPPAPKP